VIDHPPSVGLVWQRLKPKVLPVWARIMRSDGSRKGRGFLPAGTDNFKPKGV
jgi:hypothetical protein